MLPVAFRPREKIHESICASVRVGHPRQLSPPAVFKHWVVSFKEFLLLAMRKKKSAG